MMIWFLILLRLTASAMSFYPLNFAPEDNAILARLPFDWRDCRNHQKELQHAMSLLDEACNSPSTMLYFVSHKHAAMHIILFHEFENLLAKKIPLKRYEELFDWIWDTFHYVIMGRYLQELQVLAFQAGKLQLIELIKRMNHENFDRAMIRSGHPARFPTPLNQNLAQKADELLTDLEYRSELHETLMTDMFHIPKLNNISEALEFSTKLAMTRLGDFHKLLERSKHVNSIGLKKRLSTAVKIQSIILALRFQLQVFNNIKMCTDEDKKGEIVDGFLANLMSSINNTGYAIPKRETDILDKMRFPFSLKWMDIKLHMILLHAANLPDQSGISKHNSLLTKTDAVAFIINCRMILALRPFMSKFGKAAFPHLIHDKDNNALQKPMSDICDHLNGLVTNLDSSRCLAKPYNFIKHFVDFTLPNETENYIEYRGIKELKMLTLDELDNLLNKKMIRFEEIDWDNAKVPKKRKTPAKYRGPVYVEQNEIDRCIIVEKVVVSSDSNCDDSPKIDISAATKILVSEVLPIEAVTTTIEVVPELLPVKSLSSVVALKHVIPVEEDEIAAQYYMEEYQMQLDTYAKPLKGLPLSESTKSYSPGSAQVKDAPKSLPVQNTSVCKWSTNDFLDLFPDARDVFNENISNATAVQVLNSPSTNMMFRWAFNPKVVIDSTTYKFLCQVFGFAPGRKSLKFTMLQRAYLQLIGEDLTEVGSKNRTVFAFKHVFVIGDQTFVPPIKSVHPEHASSGFNHIQVKQLLECNGFHYNFFILI